MEKEKSKTDLKGESYLDDLLKSMMASQPSEQVLNVKNEELIQSDVSLNEKIGSEENLSEIEELELEQLLQNAEIEEESLPGIDELEQSLQNLETEEDPTEIEELELDKGLQNIDQTLPEDMLQEEQKNMEDEKEDIEIEQFEDMSPEDLDAIVENVLNELDEPMELEDIPMSLDEPMELEDIPMSLDEPMELEDIPMNLDEPMELEDIPMNLDEPMELEDIPMNLDESMELEDIPLNLDEPMELEDIPMSLDEPMELEDIPMSLDEPMELEDIPMSLDEPMELEDIPMSLDEPMELEDIPMSLDEPMELEDIPMNLDDTITDDAPLSLDDTAELEELIGDIGTLAPEVENKIQNSDDVGDVFAKSLEAVSSLTPDENEKSALPEMPKKKNIFVKFYEKLFKNIVTEEEKEEYEKRITDEAVSLEKKKEEKAAEQERKAAEKITQKEEQEKLKEDKKAENERKKQEKKEQQEEKKKERAAKKEEKKKLEEEQEKEYQGKINKFGAGFIFVTLGTALILFLVYSHSYHYKQSIEEAGNLFASQKYEEAYAELAGLKVKKNDKQLFDRVETIMFLQKQLNSYQTYTKEKMYPEALDSLIKGLKRYDTYIALANELGVGNDMNQMKKEIYTHLKQGFNVNKKKADNLKQIENRDKYSKSIYQITKKK